MNVAASGGPAPMRRPAGRMSDTELLGALRRGDDAAFEALCSRYESALRRYARHVLRARPAVVDDVVQEALLRAHRALRRDDRHIQVRPYLFRLVRNCCLDELARVRTDSVPLHLLVAGDEPAAAGPSVESAAEQRDRVALALGDLAALPEVQRHALVRRELDGLTHEQVAAELGITPGASRSLVYRAREALTRADAAREARCEDVRFALLRAHDDKRRAPVSALRHVAGCGACRAFRTELKHNRSTLRVLVPAPLLLLGAAGLAPALKAGVAKPVATGAVALLAAGGAAYELHQHVFEPGDPTPIPLSGVALPHGRLRTGAPLPAHTALITARAAERATSAQLSCPTGMRVAGLVPTPGSQRSLGFDPATVIGASTSAHVLFGPGDDPVDLAILCRVPSSTGSVRASSAAAASHHLIVHACRRRTSLATTPGGPAAGTITASEPLSILAGRSGWLRVRTDAGRRGWIPARVAC